jgi:hypothetical protein
MNIFGAFTFGSLIKTFLPGFVWLIAILILVYDFSDAFGLTPEFWTRITARDQAALVLAFPASILLGLLSNVIVFMGVNDVLVRKPARAKNPALFALHDELAKRIRNQSWIALAPQENLDAAQFDGNIDHEMILLERIGVEKLAYVREQYWYHLEFQLNLMLSVVVLFFAALPAVLKNGLCDSLGCLLPCIVAAFLISLGLVKSARKNYCRHIAKMASLMTAVLTPPPATSSVPPAAPANS